MIRDRREFLGTALMTIVGAKLDCRQVPNSNGGISITFRRNPVAPATTSTGTTSRSSFHPPREFHMSARWSLRVSLACSLACYPLVLEGQDKSLPQQIADELVLLAGGIHTGYRFNHAKGLVVTGTFTAGTGASSVSRAAHLQGGTAPVTVRFSDASGVPNIPDTDPGAVPHGMA